MPVFENLPVLETACADNVGKARERLAENLTRAVTQRALGVMHVETVVESKEDVDPLSCSIVQEWQEVCPVGEDDNTVESTWERQVSVFVTGEGYRQR